MTFKIDNLLKSCLHLDSLEDAEGVEDINYKMLFNECKDFIKSKGFTIITIFDPSLDEIQIKLKSGRYTMYKTSNIYEYQAMFDITASFLYSNTAENDNTSSLNNVCVRVLTEDELIEEFSEYSEGVYERYVMVAADDLVNEIMSTAGVYYDIKEIEGKYYVNNSKAVIDDFITKLLHKHNITHFLTLKITQELIKGFIEYDQFEEFLQHEHSEDSLIGYHSSLGRYIRNTYLYPIYEDIDADDVSFDMIMGLHLVCQSLQKEHTLWFNLYKDSIRVVWRKEEI